MKKSVIFMFAVLFAVSLVLPANAESGKRNLTREETSWLQKASRSEKDGWIYIHIEGEPFERGFQHGYLLANEYDEAFEATKYMMYQTTGMEYSFFLKEGVKQHKKLIPEELLEEMMGIAAGMTAAGRKTALDEIVGWNSTMEITESWWPLAKSKYTSYYSNSVGASHCSAFIATGSATEDGKIVIGHTSFDDFWSGQLANIIMDVLPSEGNRMLMQTSPGYVASMQDFYVTGAGIVCAETTIAGFNGYNAAKTPYYVRIRESMQYGSSIDECVALLEKGNNGGIAACWLIGDIKTNEIARYQQGLVYQKLDKKKDGSFFGCNAVEDPRIRNLECTGVGYNDVRRQTGGRRARWPQLLTENDGNINADTGKVMLSDTYDVYLKKDLPGANTICSHYDVDPRYYMSSPDGIWPDPYTPAGSFDGKVTTAEMARDMQMWARFGRADGVAFDADNFLEEHPQWDWQKGYLKSRPSRPWTVFESK